MKKILSILCAVTLIVTCMTGLAVSADLTFPVTLDVAGEVSQITDTFYHNNVGYTKTLQIPAGWNYFANESSSNYWHCSGTSGGAAAPIQKLTLTGAFGLTYRIYGGYLSLYRYVDVEPGYKYTITTLATVPTGNKATTKVEMYHKNTDGAYTKVEGSSVLGTGTAGEAYSGDAAGLYNATHSVTISITDPSVNALRIDMGYESGNAYNSYAAYGAVTVQRGEHVGMTVGSIDFLNIGTTATPVTGQYVSGTLNIPNGCSYKLVDTQWGTPLKLLVDKGTSAQPGNYPIVYGNDIWLTKTFDIAPGFDYTIEVGAAVTNGSKATSKYWLMHKNADGTYTEINEYLAANNYEKTVSYTNTTNVYAYAETMDYMWADGDAYRDATHSFKITATDKLINAVMVGLGGENQVGSNHSSIYTEIKVLQGESKDIIPNTRPVSVTYTSNSSTLATVTLNLTGASEVSLRPVASTVDSSVNVVSNTGYFKGWQIGENVYTSEEGKKAPIACEDKTLTMNALWYAVENNVVSGAKAQKATLADNTNVIRFLALVDDSFADYKEAGFVFTTLAANPTIEAGYKPYGFQSIYAKIKSGDTTFAVTDSEFVSKFTTGNEMNATGIIYANVVIPAANESTVYYATPYVEKADGTRVYGETKAASYANLTALDTVE